MENITAIVIAAGAATRMRTVKQLLPFGDSSLLGKVITEAQAAGVDEVITVLGANFEKIKEEIAPLITRIVKNENWEQGMGTSIAAGVQYVVDSDRPPEAVLILLGDQPIVDSEYLEHLIDTYRKEPDKIAATKYPGSLGVPAVFPAAYFSELTLLSGESGAKSILNSSENPAIGLDPGDRSLDIDTPEDYRDLRSRLEE